MIIRPQQQQQRQIPFYGESNFSFLGDKSAIYTRRIIVDCGECPDAENNIAVDIELKETENTAAIEWLE